LVKENIDTVAAHRKNPHEELPEEAQEQLNDYIEFLLNKYKKKSRFMLDDVKSIVGDRAPVSIIDMVNYGTCNGHAVLNSVLEILK
ncbi:DUF2281 domain-containing protein, partial [Clostridioides difficile]